MDKETRDAVIHTIIDYADHNGDHALFELVGWTPSRSDTTDAQGHALLAAILPLLDDERLNVLMRHIAEVLVRGYNQRDESEVAA